MLILAVTSFFGSMFLIAKALPLLCLASILELRNSVIGLRGTKTLFLPQFDYTYKISKNGGEGLQIGVYIAYTSMVCTSTLKITPVILPLHPDEA